MSFDNIALADPQIRWTVVLIAQITLVAAAGLLAAKLIRRDAATRHAVLLTSLVVLLASPFVMLLFDRSGMSLFDVPVTAPSNLEVRPAAIAENEPRPAQESLNSVATTPSPSRPLSTPDATPVTLPPAKVESQHLRLVTEETSAKRDPQLEIDNVTSPDQLSHTSDFANLLLKWAGAFWGVGVLAGLVRIIHGWIAVHRLCRTAQPTNSAEIANVSARLHELLTIRTPLRILVSDELGTAVAVGMFRPTILLPRSYVDGLSADDLFVVLTHEAAHHVRRDLVAGLAQRIAAAIYWPHPLVHLLNRRLARAREEVCDNYVLQQQNSPGYAALLLRLVQPARNWNTPSGALAFFSRRWKLEERVSALLDSRRSTSTHPRRRLFAVAALLIAVLGTTLAGIRLTDGPVNYVVSAEAPAAKSVSPPPGGATLQLGDSRFAHEGWHKNVGFSADGKVLVSSSEHSLKFWDSATGALLHQTQTGSFTPRQMRMTPDRTQAATLGFDTASGGQSGVTYGVRFWDVATGELRRKVEWVQTDGESRKFVLTPDSRFVVVGDSIGYVNVWEIASGKRLLQYRLADQDIDGLAISPDGKLIAATTHSTGLLLWDWLDGAEPEALGSGQRCAGVTFSPDGTRLAVADGTSDDVQIYDVEKRVHVQSLSDPLGYPISAEELEFTPDSKKLVVGNYIGLVDKFVAAVLVWDIDSGNMVKRLLVPGMQPRALSVDPDGTRVAAADWNTGLRIWNLKTGESIGSGQVGHSGFIRAVAFSPSSRQVFSAGSDHSARIWNAGTGEPFSKLPHDADIYTMALSADGKWAATASINDTITLWDLQQLSPRHAIKGNRPLGTAWALAFAPNSTEVIALGDDLKLRSWEVATAKPVREFQLRPSGLDLSDNANVSGRLRSQVETSEIDREIVMHLISGHAMTPDGSKVIVAAGKVYWVFDTTTGMELARRDFPFEVGAIAVSRDGQQFAVGESGRMVHSPNNPAKFERVETADLATFKLESGELIWKKRLTAYSCRPAGFSRDGKRLSVVVRSSKSPPLALYDATNGELVASVDGIEPVGTDDGVAFSGDGKRLACAQADATVLIWDLEKLAPVSGR